MTPGLIGELIAFASVDNDLNYPTRSLMACSSLLDIRARKGFDENEPASRYPTLFRVRIRLMSFIKHNYSFGVGLLL